MENNLKYWLWLTTREGLKKHQMAKLLEEFGESVESIFYASPEEFVDFGFSEKVLHQFGDKSFGKVDKILEDCDRCGMFLLTWQDATYPINLRNLVDPPMVLYGKGKLPSHVEGPTIAMVGARECSPYGVHMARGLSMELTYSKAVVVTGMAQGVDVACVEGALKAGGPLISVVAGGINKIYPVTSKGYYADVATMGVLLSEYPPDTPHRKEHFRERNRILSGISDGVMIIEAKIKGGTMLTANHAINQQRDLFVLPGDVNNPMTEGPMKLMQEDGAYPIGKVQHFFQFYKERFPNSGQSFMKSSVVESRLTEIDSRVELPSVPKEKSNVDKKIVSSDSGEKIKSPEEAHNTASPVAEQLEKIKVKLSDYSEKEANVLRMLKDKVMDVDVLSLETELPVQELLSTLTSLMVEGCVDEVANRKFQLMVEIEES